MNHNREFRFSRFTGITFLVLFIVVTVASNLIAVPAPQNYKFEVIQPDQTTITLTVLGDERTGRYVSESGYTVVQNGEGWYCYAVVDESGQLKPSNVVVSLPDQETERELKFQSTIPKALSPGSGRLRPELNQEDLKRDFSGDTRYLDIADVLVIMVRFPDEDTTLSVTDFDNLMNRPGFHTYGSVNEYYQEVSYGQFSVNGVVIGWYTGVQ